MHVQGLFPTPLAYLQLDLDHTAIAQHALELQQQQPQGNRPGGWQSSFLDLTDDVVSDLTHAIQMCADNLASELWQLTNNCKLTVTQGWCNINTDAAQLANNWSHMHPGAFMSFVYYAAAPEHSGDLVIEPPHSWNDYCVPEYNLTQLNPWNAQRHHYTPQEGMLIGFPGWLKHQAQPNQSGKPRISYAFNAQIQGC